VTERLDRRPVAAVVYWKREAPDLVATAGLEVRTLIPGFWPGRVAQPTGQDQLVLGLARGG
jgi:hypothetical protein